MSSTRFEPEGASSARQLYITIPVYKGKGKGRLWVLQPCYLEAFCTLTRMSSFNHLQRRCTHQAT